jgi:CRISPR-associated endonuclease/helicase Cas3
VEASFDALVERACGYPPYDYQRRLAHDGLPELLRVPTGGGKTLAATLPWLYRRRFHPDPTVRAATPRWLVVVLPMRVLVEQTATVVLNWLERLGLDEEIGLHVVRGGEGQVESRWRLAPEREAIFVGTLDMLLSRTLNRGYGESRFSWPLDFGLLNAGVQWVFDEVQLMGPALPTSRQLEGLRRALGTALPCASMWMSATVDPEQLITVDLPRVDGVVEPGPTDWQGPLRRRLEATKVVRQLPIADHKSYVHQIAAGLAGAHRPGTLTLAIVNTVVRARELLEALASTSPAELVLLHSRFRLGDRASRVKEALARLDPDGPGRIVVSTQVVEAGADLSATTLFTEVAPWPSVVQRAGRCNRDGRAEGACVLWASPPHPAPYDAADIAAALSALRGLEGAMVTGPKLGSRAVPVKPVVHPVLRRRDLLELFDTMPDLSGNDIDVGRFLRPVEDLDVQVAWRPLGLSGPDEQEAAPTRGEQCAVPVGEVRKALEGERRAWRFDHIDGGWVRCRAADIRPGLVILLDAGEGGYQPTVGFDPASNETVPPAAPAERDAPSPLVDSEEAVGDDPLTHTPRRWVPLRRHLEDVERAARSLAGALAPMGLHPDHLEAAAVAARLHDVGKAHPVFQDTLRNTAANDDERASAELVSAPWAKSGGSRRPRHSRRYFRHELAGALALLGDGTVALDGLAEPELAIYLVAAHHGRVRIAIRSLPGEALPGGTHQAMGIQEGDLLPAVDVPGTPLPPRRLDLLPMELGTSGDGKPSWTERALALRDRPDLGPFRLAFLEALVRLADWRASAREET